MARKKANVCGGSFPIFAVLVLAVGVLWLLHDMGKIAFSLPWWPTLVIIFSLGWIIKHNHMCTCGCMK